MKRPMVYMLVSYILGLMAFKYNLVIVSSAIVMLWVIFFYKNRRNIFVVLIIFLYILGLLRANLSEYICTTYEREINKEVLQEEVIKIGRIIKIKQYEDGLKKLTVKLDKYNINVYTKLDYEFMYNNLIKVNGKIHVYNKVRSKGQFNIKRYMDIRNIRGKIYAKDIKIIGRKKDINSIIYDLKNNIKDKISFYLKGDNKSLFNSILLGDKDELDAKVKEQYNIAGVSHIIAISGMHIFLISIILYKIFEWLGINIRVNCIINIILLILYLIITNYNISTIRAVMMACIVLVGIILNRDKDIYSSLSFSALLILMYQPLFIFDVGFLLSYMAVLSLIFNSKIINYKIKSINRYISTLIISSIIVNIYIFPILVNNFYQISTYFLISNILIIPLIGILIFIGILGIVFSFINIFITEKLFLIIDYIICYYNMITKFVCGFKYSTIKIGHLNSFNIISYYFIIIICTLIINKYIKIDINKVIKIICIVIICNIIVWYIFRDMNITILDVGQGDSILVKTNKNRVILIDGGGKYLPNKSLQNTGKKVVEPYLKYIGKDKIDIVIVTHPDFDHVGGILEIIDDIKIDKIILPKGNIESDDLYCEMLNKINDNNIELVKMKKGDNFIIDGIKFKCIYPDIYIDDRAINNNNYSLVFKISYKDFSMLLTGDIEEEDEDIILLNKNDIECDFLKVPHHGSLTSSSEEFIEGVNPKYGFISAGKSRYKHPNDKVLKRYNKKNIKLYITKNSGSIYINKILGKIYINTQLKKVNK